MHEYKTLLDEASSGPLSGILDILGLDAEAIASGITGTLAKSKIPGEFKMTSNIAKEAKGLTAVFPVLVSEAVGIEEAQMITKAAERKYVSMLQMLFAASQITDAKSAQAYLKRFHNNISTTLDLSDMNVDDVIDFANKLDEEVKISAYGNAKINEATQAVLKDLAHNDDYYTQLSEGINSYSLNDYSVTKDFGDYKAFRKSISEETRITDSTRTETKKSGNSGVTTVTINTTETIKKDKSTQELETIQRYKNLSDILKNNSAIYKDSVSRIKDASEILSKQIISTDIKKANEATPSLMIINFVTQANGTDNEIVNTAVIGVKCIIHYVSSNEMMNRMVLKNNDRRGLFNFIRATTGEIKFFKDFLFAVDRAKIDAVAKTNKGSDSKIWKMLEIRANRAKINNKARGDNSACAAITMLVLSSEEVEVVKSVYRVDLNNSSTMLGVMRGYNFIGVGIVDAVNEKIKFLYDDGTKNFETMSFMALEREQSNGEYKKMINTLVKGR